MASGIVCGAAEIVDRLSLIFQLHLNISPVDDSFYFYFVYFT